MYVVYRVQGVRFVDCSRFARLRFLCAVLREGVAGPHGRVTPADGSCFR